MDTMNKSLITALLLSCATTAYAETPKRTAFIFASFRDTTATDPIDKNVTWRNVAMTYQSIRGLGIPGDEIYIFYNDIKPNKEDNSISLKVELDAHTLYPGEYSKLEEIFKEKTNNLSSKDEVILTTLSHGADGILYCDYGSRVSGLELSRLVNTTQARTAAYYSACYSQLILLHRQTEDICAGLTGITAIIQIILKPLQKKRLILMETAKSLLRKLQNLCMENGMAI